MLILKFLTIKMGRWKVVVRYSKNIAPEKRRNHSWGSLLDFPVLLWDVPRQKQKTSYLKGNYNTFSRSGHHVGGLEVASLNSFCCSGREKPKMEKEGQYHVKLLKRSNKIKLQPAMFGFFLWLPEQAVNHPANVLSTWGSDKKPSAHTGQPLQT